MISCDGGMSAAEVWVQGRWKRQPKLKEKATNVDESKGQTLEEGDCLKAKMKPETELEHLKGAP